MSKEDGLAIRCPQVDGSLLEGLLVDYDVSPGQCTIEVFFSWRDWASIVFDNRFNVGDDEIERLGRLPSPGSQVLVRMQTSQKRLSGISNVDQFTDFLAPIIARDDYDFFDERSWTVTHYRQAMDLPEDQRGELNLGFVVESS